MAWAMVNMVHTRRIEEPYAAVAYPYPGTLATTAISYAFWHMWNKANLHIAVFVEFEMKARAEKP